MNKIMVLVCILVLIVTILAVVSNRKLPEQQVDSSLKVVSSSTHSDVSNKSVKVLEDEKSTDFDKDSKVLVENDVYEFDYYFTQFQHNLEDEYKYVKQYSFVTDVTKNDQDFIEWKITSNGKYVGVVGITNERGIKIIKNQATLAAEDYSEFIKDDTIFKIEAPDWRITKIGNIPYYYSSIYAGKYGPSAFGKDMGYRKIIADADLYLYTQITFFDKDSEVVLSDAGVQILKKQTDYYLTEGVHFTGPQGDAGNLVTNFMRSTVKSESELLKIAVSIK